MLTPLMDFPLNLATVSFAIRIPARQPEPKHGWTEETPPRIALSILEAAKMLGISKPHFYPLIREGKIRTVKIGRRILVSVQSLRDFIDGTKEPCDPPENTAELQGKKEEKRHCNPPPPPLAIRRCSGNIDTGNCVGCRKKGEDINGNTHS